jgi:hypothetical protein
MVWRLIGHGLEPSSFDGRYRRPDTQPSLPTGLREGVGVTAAVSDLLTHVKITECGSGCASASHRLSVPQRDAMPDPAGLAQPGARHQSGVGLGRPAQVR